MKKINKSDSAFIFLRKSYDETLELISLAENYFSANGQRDKRLLSAEDKLSYTLIMSDITVRLTSTLSWLMLMRAVEEGEVEVTDKNLEDFRLTEISSHLGEDHPIYNLVPLPVRNLFKKTHNLYDRVMRLEKEIRENPENIMA